MPAGQTTATLCYDADYYPYGGEKVVTNTCPQNYKWTGKERDAETGNDAVATVQKANATDNQNDHHFHQQIDVHP